MWLPRDYNLGLLMALGALLCWGSWSSTLMVTKERMNFEKFLVNFTVAFFLTGWIVGFIGGSLGEDSWQLPHEQRPQTYISELLGHNLGCYPLSMLGGVLWNIANILVGKGITMMGQALGFPICVGLGLVSGAITAYVISPVGDLYYLASGISVAVSAICLTGYMSFSKERELEQMRRIPAENALELAMHSSDGHIELHAKEPSAVRKLSVCIVGGVFLGLSNIGVTGATSNEFLLCSMSPYANQSFFSLGVFLSSCLLIPLVVHFPIEGGSGTDISHVLKGYGDISLVDHLLSALGGILVCMGFFFFNLGSSQLGSATAYSIGQSAPLVPGGEAGFTYGRK